MGTSQVNYLMQSKHHPTSRLLLKKRPFLEDHTWWNVGYKHSFYFEIKATPTFLPLFAGMAPIYTPYGKKKQNILLCDTILELKKNNKKSFFGEQREFEEVQGVGHVFEIFWTVSSLRK